MLTSNRIEDRGPLWLAGRLALSLSVCVWMLSSAWIVKAQTVYPSWSYTGNLNTVRNGFTMTLLTSGKVLVAGGSNCSKGTCAITDSAELYDPATGVWTITGKLNTARTEHTATLLPNGKVLVSGGYPTTSAFLSSELFDPATGIWSKTGNLNTGRASHMATILPNGLVLIAGGVHLMGNTWGLLNSAELYDPATGTWSNTGSLNTARVGTATLLPNGKVLVPGGFSRYDCPDGCKVLASAELYDPATKVWTSTGDLNTARGGHTATLLANGKLLVVGGLDGSSIDPVTGSAELYDPATGSWSRTSSLAPARFGHTATLLLNGKVLVSGGAGSNLNFTSRAELFDPTTGEWSITAYRNSTGSVVNATLLPNGNVLIAGEAFNDSASCELYAPSSSPNINMINDAKFYVQQHYIDFLSREPDADGLAFWTNEITSCGVDTQCQEVKRVNVSAAFYLSIEFQETAFFVYRVHKAAHGNPPGLPVPVRLDEFLSNTSEVRQGVIVGQPGWEQALEFNKQSFINDPDGGDRWTSAYPTSMTPSSFVDTLFANAEVTPSTSERAAAINEFGFATETFDIAARARALRRVADNSTLREQEFNRAFVLMQYFGYLRRNPNDAPDGNFEGYNFWLNKLNQFNGDFIGAEMVRSFLVSTEYRRRFGP